MNFKIEIVSQFHKHTYNQRESFFPMTSDVKGVHKCKSSIFKQATPWPSKTPQLLRVWPYNYPMC